MKVLRQDQNFSTGLQCAIKKIGEIYYSIVNTRYSSEKILNNKLQSQKVEKKIKILPKHI